MREYGIRARALQTYSKPAKLKLFYQDIENKRMVMAKPTEVNQQWSGDLTYLKVGARWHYLAVVIDLYSRKVIGWSFGENKTTQLTLRALKQAIRTRKPQNAVLFHTDRGAEYRANEVQRFLSKNNVISSMNRPGCCTDNAEVESFFHSLKADLIRGNRYDSASSLYASLKSYLDDFYNRQRLHSSLGYKTPVEFELAAQ
jgi:transposase InsO family protein